MATTVLERREVEDKARDNIQRNAFRPRWPRERGEAEPSPYIDLSIYIHPKKEITERLCCPFESVLS